MREGEAVRPPTPLAARDQPPPSASTSWNCPPLARDTTACRCTLTCSLAASFSSESRRSRPARRRTPQPISSAPRLSCELGLHHCRFVADFWMSLHEVLGTRLIFRTPPPNDCQLEGSHAALVGDALPVRATIQGRAESE